MADADSYEEQVREQLHKMDRKLKERYIEKYPEVVDEVREMFVRARTEFCKDTIKIRMEQQQSDYISEYTRKEHDQMVEERLEEAGIQEQIEETIDEGFDEESLLYMASRYKAPDRRAQQRQQILQWISVLLKEKDFEYEPPEEPEIVLNKDDEVVYRLCEIAEEEGLEATRDLDTIYSAIRDVFPDREDYMRASLTLGLTRNIAPELNDIEEDPAVSGPAIRFVEGQESAVVQAFRPLVASKADAIYEGESV